MSEVSIAPAALLGKRNQAQTSFVINQQPNLPLGDKTAIVRDTFNYDSLSTEYKFPTVPDAVERNNNTNDQKFTLQISSSIGKKSAEGPKHIHDRTSIVNYIKKTDDQYTMNEYKNEMTSHFNLTATPFVTAKSIYPEIMNT